jgi:hypothetical protein
MKKLINFKIEVNPIVLVSNPKGGRFALIQFREIWRLLRRWCHFLEKLELLVPETAEKLEFSKEKMTEEDKIWESMIMYIILRKA